MLKVFANRTNHKLKLFFYLYSYNSLIQTNNNCSSVKFNKSTSNNLTTKFLYNFNSQVNLLTILNMVKSLNSYDSMILDQFCFIFGTNYQNQSSKQAIIEKMILKYSKIIPQSTQKEANQNCETILEAIIKVYQFFDEAKVGFLRGDLHSKTIFKLQKFLRKKYAENKSLKQRDFKNFLNNITSKKNFCLPEKGIYARHLQSKNNLYQRQLVLENVSSIQAIEKFRQVLESLVSLDKIHMTETVKVYIIEWMPNLMKAVRSQHQKCRSKPINKQQSLYGLYLLKINAQRISSLALSQLMVKIMQNIFEKNLNPKKQFEVDIYEKQLRNNIGRLLNYQCIYQRQQKKFKQVQKIYDSQKKQEFKFKNQKNKEKSAKQSVDKQKIGETNSLKKKQNSDINIEQNEINPSLNKLAYKYIKPKDRADYLENIKNKIMKYHDKNIPIEIPKEIQKMLGQLLVYLMKQIIRIKNKHGFQVPLLTEEYKYSSSKGKIFRSIILKINEDFVKAILPKIEKQGNLFIHQDRSLPTIIQPMPWITPDIGGYYLRATEFMRYSNCVIQEKLIKHADLYRMFNVLNYLNRTPWKINKKILKIVQELWGQGGGISQIPIRYSDLIATQKAKLKKQTNFNKKQQILKKIQLLRDQHSLRSDFILKLAICQSYSKLDKFYLPNNVDFRGRTYPVPPHFNHIGSDLSRGLLLFGNGKQLGSTGLKWLKIHCANLMDQNKSTIKQKQQFINQNLKLIEEIVDNPLKNLQWLDYEDHWQALATMMELIEALKHPNINEFVSYLHIHQDGSCNGLQHYAALGRDIQGAYQVNLGQSDHPGDIYTHVSKAVNKLIQEEVKNSSSQHYQISKKLLNKVKRKTVKQTVMTSVYGVTFIGAREQIYRQLLDQDFLQPKDCYQASIYIAKLTLKAISNLFQGAHRIKSWLLESSKIIVSTNSPVGWITPMGLPVSQPYRRQSQVDIVDTITQTLKVQAGLHKLPFDKSRQKSAFPPNFIHSLDSTHMLYTAQECMKHQLTFTAVHDSYWTHAGDVDKMNQILREKFIELHQEPILQRLKQSFQMKFPNLKFPQIPQRGQFNLEKVKQSTYFFS